MGWGLGGWPYVSRALATLFEQLMQLLPTLSPASISSLPLPDCPAGWESTFSSGHPGKS